MSERHDREVYSIILRLRSETQPICGHENPVELQRLWDELIHALELEAYQSEVQER